MHFQREATGESLSLDSTAELGRGGEACIYALSSSNALAAKVYHKPTAAHVRKLAAMLASPPDDPTVARGHISIAWPVDLLYTTDGTQQLVGFLMPRVIGTHPIMDFYNPKTRRQKFPWFDYRFLHRTACNLALAVQALHTRGYVIGDVNAKNILVTHTAPEAGLVTFVDTDSFQVHDANTRVVHRCPVGSVEFTPPELQGKSFSRVDRAPEHDLFGVAVLLFLLLMEGTYPFGGVYQGRGEPLTLPQCIQAGYFPYSGRRRAPYSPPPLAPPLNILHSSLQELFVRCFIEGYTNPQARPNAQIWQSQLREAEKALVTCPVNAQHHYDNHLSTCPWCERTAQLRGRDPFPSRPVASRAQPTLSAHRPSGPPRVWTQPSPPMQVHLPLGSPTSPLPPPSLLSPALSCPRCNGNNNQTDIYCQHCRRPLYGHRLCPHGRFPFPLPFIPWLGRHRAPVNARYCPVCGGLL